MAADELNKLSKALNYLNINKRAINCITLNNKLAEDYVTNLVKIKSIEVLNGNNIFFT